MARSIRSVRYTCIYWICHLASLQAVIEVLEDCPFCGKRLELTDNPAMGILEIYCDKCRVSMIRVLSDYKNQVREARKELITTWNKRYHEEMLYRCRDDG